MLSTLLELLGLAVMVGACFTLGVFPGLLCLGLVLIFLGYLGEKPDPPKPPTTHGYI